MDSHATPIAHHGNLEVWLVGDSKEAATLFHSTNFAIDCGAQATPPPQLAALGVVIRGWEPNSLISKNLVLLNLDHCIQWREFLSILPLSERSWT